MYGTWHLLYGGNFHLIRHFAGLLAKNNARDFQVIYTYYLYFNEETNRQRC